MPCPFPCQGKLSVGFGDRPSLELLRALRELQQHCALLREENQRLVSPGCWLELGEGRLSLSAPLPPCPPHPICISRSGGHMELT